MQKDVALSRYSTFQIGGPAAFFLPCHTVDDIRQGVSFAHEKNIPTLVLGSGSNCLFADEGFPGLVLHNRLVSCERDGNGLFVVGAGYSFAKLGVQTVRQGFSGLEYAAGIPGSLGGAIFMNAGANGQEIASVVRFVDIFIHGQIQRLEREEISFMYRFSSFQKMPAIIVGAGISLVKDETALARQKEFLEQRKKSQPFKEPSAGCVFRNPPGYSAGRLIEEVGLKGACVGGAEISPVHANFIVNKGNAKASDVLSLMKLVQKTVLEKKGVSLASEVRIV